MTDFEIFHTAARCFLAGQSPYYCAPGWFYPLPTVYVFLPFALLPLPIAKIAWFAASLVALVAALKRRALLFMLFVPVLQVLWQGQLDLLLLPALASGTGIGMAIMTLKPQLVVLFLPLWWWSATWSERKRFVVFCVLLWGSSLILYPSWPWAFVEITRGPVGAAYVSPSLWAGGNPWWLVVPLGVLFVAVAREKYAATLAFNPFILSYDLSMVALRAPWWIVPLSWPLMWMNTATVSAWSFAALSFLVAVWPAGKATAAISPRSARTPSAAPVSQAQSAGR